DIQGIQVLFAKSHLWPNPANIFAIPDDQGFSMIDVGGGGTLGYEHLHNGLNQLDLKLGDVHTVVLSHAHPDHMGAIRDVLDEARPKVFIHHLDVVPALDPGHLYHTFNIELAKEKFAGANQFQDFDLFKFFDDFGCSMNAADEVEELRGGEVVRLGNFAFEVLHTPGHAPGHISLFEKKRGVLLAGDLVGISPAWYTPASGGLTGYLESLDKMESKNASLLIPAHGPVMDDASGAINKIRTKLLKREAILLDALKKEPMTFLELNAALFPAEIIHFFPGCGIIESHLIKLEAEGLIEREGDLISLASA
ncbi:MAG: MBL fold metallo-hydrolase, partial [Thermodesulfobacteriota bacterium]|nr:MBL fold metallo-hydrolase [Thermodesulfobacteriota bacterium]